MVVSQSSMNLRQRQVAELPRDFLGNQAQVVPLSDPANRYARSGDARPTATNFGAPGDQASYFGEGCHRLKYNAADIQNSGNRAVKPSLRITSPPFRFSHA